MFDRANPSRLLKGVLAGLRRRSRTGEEKPDVGARILLFGVPLAIMGTLIATRIVINYAEVSLAAAALLVGALLAGFSQVASWRERITARSRAVDAVRIRALNEAGALILMSIHVSVIASIAAFAVALIDSDKAEGLRLWLSVVLSAIGAAALAYVILSLVFVTNLLWDGFMSDQADSERDALPEFDEGNEPHR